jgi:hypothetical protein
VLLTHNTDVSDTWEREGETRMLLLVLAAWYAIGVNVVMCPHAHPQPDRGVLSQICIRLKADATSAAAASCSGLALRAELEARVDHPYPWLKYLPADDLDDQEVDFDGMKVDSPASEGLGKVEGFIVDSESGRPYYTVVNAGGWFKSKHFLLPVGHVRFEADREALMADTTKERVERFPGFDLSKFDKMSVDDLKRLNVEMLQACTISGVVYAYSETEPYTDAWDRADFSYPDWWRESRRNECPRSGSQGRGWIESAAVGLFRSIEPRT